jgi:hypothetical protein
MSQEQVTITKALITKGINLTAFYTEKIPTGDSHLKNDAKQPIHPDLVDAFSDLDDHLARLTFQRNSEGDFAFPEVHCSGFSLNLKDENGIKVTLYGSRHLQSGKSLELASPPQSLLETSIEMYEYEYREQLDNAIKKCDDEVRAYLFDGKWDETGTQTAMEFDGEEIKTEGEKKVRKGKGKVKITVSTSFDETPADFEDVPSVEIKEEEKPFA